MVLFFDTQPPSGSFPCARRGHTRRRYFPPPSIIIIIIIIFIIIIFDIIIIIIIVIIVFLLITTPLLQVVSPAHDGVTRAGVTYRLLPPACFGYRGSVAAAPRLSTSSNRGGTGSGTLRIYIYIYIYTHIYIQRVMISCNSLC